MSSLARSSLVALALSASLGTAVGAETGIDVQHALFVPNRASASIAVIDIRTDQVVATLPVGNVPHQVAVSDITNQMVATNTADDTITIIDLASGASRTMPLAHEPEHMELGPDGHTLAIGNIGAGAVSLVALPEGKELHRVTGLSQPHNLTFSPDGKRLYVANLGANHVSVVDVAAGQVVDEIPVAPPVEVASRQPADGEYQGIINVTRTPDGRLGFAAHGEGNRLAVLDLRTGAVKKTLELGELPWRAYSTADGRYMLVPNNGDATLSIIATADQSVVATLPSAEDITGVNTGWFETTAFALSRAEKKAMVYDLTSLSAAGEIALPGTPETGVTTPDGTKLYVALSDTDQVAVIDVRTRQLVKTIDQVGDEPWGVTLEGAMNYCH